jgi:gluconate:H+ symporter, GntP family
LTFPERVRFVLLIILLLVSVAFIVVSTCKFQLHPFLALLFAAVGFGLCAGMPLDEIVESINDGFGGTIGSIGIVIIAGVIIGQFLENSGGAYAMADMILKVIGKKHVPMAMSIIGYVISVPVFADSGFVILTPLNRALSKEAKISLATSAIALATGLIATHCLVPPTPGPIYAALYLKADLGYVIVLGLFVSAVALFVGWLFATKVASRVYIDPDPKVSEADVRAKLEGAPSPLKAFTPIVVPILLIVANSFFGHPPESPAPAAEQVVADANEAELANLETTVAGEDEQEQILAAADDSGLESPGTATAVPGEKEPLNFKDVIGFLGQPVIALLIGVLLAFMLPKKLDKEMLSANGWVGQAVLGAALIIMVTGAGGAFGQVLRNSQIKTVLGESLSQANLGIFLPFVIATALKTAQGSSTVALITTSALIEPLMTPLGFETPMAKALVVLSIGAGSMMLSHANDSFFWVVTQMTKMDVKTGYKLHTTATLAIGLASIVTIWVISLVAL